MEIKRVYTFGNGTAEGKADMKNLLGGKGANLAEMNLIGVPVPPGFTITTDVCTEYYQLGEETVIGLLDGEVKKAVRHIESLMKSTLGDVENPLLVSVRSGARASMPGMMDTVLNIGLCSATIPGMLKKTGNPRFVYDSYRRLIMMYADVVMDKANQLDKNIRRKLDDMLEEYKEYKGFHSDTELTADDLKYLAEEFKKKVKEVLGVAFPDDAKEQLIGAIKAVFQSWNGNKAISYRRIEGIPDEWGTAVNVQAMVFGNMGDTSATGVAFTRNPATGENLFYGEWLINAQGEDVVAGIRTPNPLNNATKNTQNEHLASLEEQNPVVYKELFDIRCRLEEHYHDMLDIEFTIQEGKLYMLQCRVGKRNGTAALNMAIEMLHEGMIDEKTAIMRVAPEQLDELLHPLVDKKAEETATLICKGLPAGPGGAVGQAVFTAEDAVVVAAKGVKPILIRKETNPEDVEGMRVAEGILTSLGGMTSHAALIARGWGKCCIVGAGSLEVDEEKKIAADKITGQVIKEGDLVTLNGTKGHAYVGALATIDASENPSLQEFMTLVDKCRRMLVRTNADNPEDAAIARKFGAQGIGLFRTEHTFYAKGNEEALYKLRKMILSTSDEERTANINALELYFKNDMKATLDVMDGLGVTFRLLDPPLHEFAPHSEPQQLELAKEMHLTLEEVKTRVDALHETNPMMGHRGIRLGITYPKLTEMQVRAIFEASAELLKEGKHPKPEIMVPVTIGGEELVITKVIVDKVLKEVENKYGVKIAFMYGSMLEIPRACFMANKMAETAEFFSFGTNDLTQMTYGFSRDDASNFIPDYLKNKIIERDPFQTIDPNGVGELITIACERGRSVRPNIKVGICGEQGGDPKSVELCEKNNLTYVSCSPFRVPIARLAAAQATIKLNK